MNTDIKIFVNYRRADSTCFAERVRDWFILSYKRENVFMDFDAIPPFVDFEVFIIEQIKKVDVMLVIIGPRWQEILLERAKTTDIDYVRLEISKALSMGKLVAPILVDGASAPNMNALPPDIRGMMRTNIPRLDGGRQFLDNIERIVTALPNALAHHAQVQSVSMDEAEHILETQDSEMPFFPANTSDSVDDISSPVKSSPIPPPAPAPRAPARESSNASRFPISSRKRGEDADDISALPTTEPTPVKRQVAVYAVEQDHELLQHIEQDLTSLGLDVLVNESAQEANLTVIVLSPEAKYSDRMHEEIARLQSQGLPMLSVLGAGDSSSALPYSIAANQTIDLRDYDANRSTLIAAVQAFI